MTTENLAQSGKRETIADGVTFMWLPEAGTEPVTLHISGDEMKQPVRLVTKPGITIERVSGNYAYVSYNVTADTPEQMGYRVIWVMSWLQVKGYAHIAWITKSPRQSTGYAGKQQRKTKDRK